MKKSRTLPILIFSLLAFGLVVIANSTVVSSTNLYGSPYRFAVLQLVWIVLGLAGFFFFYNFDYKKLEKFSTILFFTVLIFLAVLSVISFLPCSLNIGFAPCVNGANRWFYINPPPLPKIPFLGMLGFQPGELAKVSLILYLSFKLAGMKTHGVEEKPGIERSRTDKPRTERSTGASKNPFLLYLITCGSVSALVMLEPNMSTAAMIFIIGSVVYFSSGARLKELFVMIPALLAGAIGAIFISPYRRARFFTLLKGDSDSALSTGYHIKQILLALGAGGFWGVGFGQSKQKFSYLPEVASDSIFAIIGEEFGFIGTTLVVLAFGYLIYKGFKISKNAHDWSGRLIAAGITAWMGLQFFVNAAAMTKIIPLTGVPIPLISYGGSSMLFSMSALGILCNIDKQNS